MKYGLIGRTFAIAVAAVAILIPIWMIEGKISERQGRAHQVVTQFAAETSASQLVVGPVLALTCEEAVEVERQVMHGGKAETIRENRTQPCATGYFPPRAFHATASMPVESLHRGIYPIRLYRAKLSLSGDVDWPALPSTNDAVSREWKQAYLVTYVRDPRGIKSITPSDFGGTEATLDRFALREPIGSYVSRRPGTRVPFAYDMTLVGTSSLGIAPVGDQSDIQFTSDWPHPSFGSDWSPDQRNVGAAGFDARWAMTSVATGGQATWSKWMSATAIDTAPSAKVSLFDPVNVYSLSYRATEYAFLFVLFTFTALALAEAVAGIRLHVVQYLLVGSALAVFFLLLIAMSEHLAFDTSYLAAASACVCLLTFYLRHPLGSWPRALLFSGIFAALYATLYSLLQSEDNALLMGSLVTFSILALVMVATRKVEWARLDVSIMGTPRPSRASTPGGVPT
ncbi:MAG TPA: cell envelope integrity protein CreD [Usitatibacter sp.]